MKKRLGASDIFFTIPADLIVSGGHKNPNIIAGRIRNKFKDTGFTPVKGRVINTPIIQECPYNLECRVIKEVDFGKWFVIFGEILKCELK